MGIIFVILLITPTVTWHFVIYVTVGNDSNPARMEGIITPILSLRRLRFKAVSMQLGDQKLGVRKGVVFVTYKFDTSIQWNRLQLHK